MRLWYVQVDVDEDVEDYENGWSITSTFLEYTLSDNCNRTKIYLFPTKFKLETFLVAKDWASQKMVGIEVYKIGKSKVEDALRIDVCHHVIY